MTKEMNVDIKQTYWNKNGKYQNVYDKLSLLIPKVNLTDHSYMNLLITFGNLYYDLYNNNLCNKDIKLPELIPYLEEFEKEIKEHLPSKKYFTSVKNGKRDFEAFELIMDTILQFHEKYPYESQIDRKDTLADYK